MGENICHISNKRLTSRIYYNSQQKKSNNLTEKWADLDILPDHIQMARSI